MNKKLLAVAVAGALALPGVALAQSSVTISGVFKMSFDNIKLGQSAKSRNSESRVIDESSAIRFNVVEDLGGGLQAIGQVDWRVQLDSGGDAANGNDHIGLRSKTWGRIFFGRQDLHYFNRESELTTTGAGSLKADTISLLSFMRDGSTAIAGATRTPNVVHYTTPNWGGFTLIAAYSTAPALGTFGASVPESDINSGRRRGRAWHLNPNMAGANWQIGYSYWSGKQDAGGNALATGDQRGDRLYGSYRWGGFKLGLAWDKSKVKGATDGVTYGNRTAWSIPASYTWGPHMINAHYTKARNDKATAVNDAAKMFAIAYGYNLSKRTALALTYYKISNDTGAAYNPFTGTGGLGNAASTAAAGEDPRGLAATIRHNF